jgi:hypothetical protein
LWPHAFISVLGIRLIQNHAQPHHLIFNEVERTSLLLPAV